MTRVLKQKGSWAVILEPRDCWVGGYWDSKYVYITLIPCFPLRYTRCSK